MKNCTLGPALLALIAAVPVAAAPVPAFGPPPAAAASGALPAPVALPSADGDPVCSLLPEPALDWAAAQRRLTRCNRALRAALHDVDAARADIRTAGQRPNPTLTAGAGNLGSRFGIGSGGPLDKQVDYVARLDQPVERGNKRALRTESAERSWQAARWTAADALRQQRLALADAWIDLWGGQERARLHREIIGLVRRTLEGAQRRLKAGDIASSDVARINLDLQRAEGELTAAEGALAEARHALADLLAIGAGVAALQAIEPWPVIDLSAAVPDAARADRPDLRAADAQAAAADAQSRLARTLATRDVTVGVQGERYAPPAGNGWTVALSVSVPLFVNHRHGGEIARAEADRDAALEARERLQRQALADLRRRLDAQAAARARRLRLEREALPVAERVASDADLAYRKGAGTVLDLLDALRQLRALQLDALDARLDDDRANAAARAEMLTAAAAADPVFGDALQWPLER